MILRRRFWDGFADNCYQDWLYSEGEDTTKAVYVARMEELRSKIAPIAQRYFDKEEEKRQSYLASRNEGETMRKAQEELNKRQADSRKNGNNKKQEAEKPQQEMEIDMDMD